MRHDEQSEVGVASESLDVQGARVLVADDDEAMRRMVNATLQDHGYGWKRRRRSRCR